MVVGSHSEDAVDDRLLTVSSAAAMLRISASAVRDAVDRGQLPAVRTRGGHRRLRIEDVEMLRRTLFPSTHGDDRA